MSATATGWVFDKSPYKGALFALHLAIADTVNDTYGNELWAAVATLAEKARLGERIVRKGLAQMVDDGLLELVSARNGHVRRYRFLMPANPCTSCTPAQGAPLHVVPETPARGAQTPARRAETPAPRAAVSQVTQAEPKQEPNTLAADLRIAHQHRPATDESFAAFWDAYPLKAGKGAAQKAWRKAIKAALPADIIAGAERYRDDPIRKPDFTKHPDRWLEDQRWLDEAPQYRRTNAKGVTAAQRLLHRHGANAVKELNP